VNSVTSLSSSAGALANTYTFDSFGKLTASTGTLSNRFQYTGREFDPETGIYDHRARYYDPGVGRFASEDPVQFKGGVDFYAYGHGNPISRTDPLGLCPTPEDPKKECGNEAPMSPDSSQNPYPAGYFYLNIQANYMYHYGGNNPWGNMVRSCLICMYNHGVDAAAAHSFCYANASSHVPFWDMVWGYAAAINAGLTFVDQQGGVGGPLPYH
jgi:RHS repeat-associated protein